jgi:amino acid transporter
MTIDTKTPIMLAWLLGMLLSPEALAMQGNLAGLGGMVFWLPVLLALILHGLHTVGFDETPPFRPVRGRWRTASTSLLLLIARPAMAVCLATAALVTAGFVFNEVFVYWFPNFGFAALLLGLILGLNLLGSRTAAAAQTVFAFAALIGLVGLALTGLLGEGAQSPKQAIRSVAAFPDVETFGLAAIVLVGWDLVGYTNGGDTPDRSRATIFVGLAAAVLVFGAWNLAALLRVDPSRLADTTIPHILAARAIGDQAGRLVMGVVVIAGACAAVNLQFRAVARMLAEMAAQKLMPAFIAPNPERPWRPLVGMAALTALLMTSGFAGSDALDMSLRAGLVLWLTAMGLSHLAALLGMSTPMQAAAPVRSVYTTLRHLTVLTAMPILAGILVATDEEPQTLLTYITILAGTAVGLAVAGRLAAHHMSSDNRHTATLTKGAMQ